MQLELPLTSAPRDKHADGHKTEPISAEDSKQLLKEWRALHPEFSEEDWEYAMVELKEYLKVAWEIYRGRHPELNLPEAL